MRRAASFKSPSSIATCALLDAGIDARPRSRFEASAASNDFWYDSAASLQRSKTAWAFPRLLSVRASSESDADRCSDATERSQSSFAVPVGATPSVAFWEPRINSTVPLPSQAVASLASAAVSASNAVRPRRTCRR